MAGALTGPQEAVPTMPSVLDGTPANTSRRGGTIWMYRSGRSAAVVLIDPCSTIGMA